MGLPKNLESLFWDCDFHAVRMDEHRNFIIRRILDRGNWEAISWLRRTVGDQIIREWFLQKEGGGLDPRKLRFWGLVLDLPVDELDEWVCRERTSPWHARLAE